MKIAIRCLLICFLGGVFAPCAQGAPSVEDLAKIVALQQTQLQKLSAQVSEVGRVTFSKQPDSRFTGLTEVDKWYLTGESLTIKVPAGPPKSYLIVMRQMVHSNAAIASWLFRLNESTTFASNDLFRPHANVGSVWGTVNAQAFVTLPGGSTITYYVGVYMNRVEGHPIASPQVGNAASDGRLYSDLFAVQL